MYSAPNLMRISAVITPVQTALAAATSSAEVNALASLSAAALDVEHLVIFSCDAACRVRFGATGLAAASATTGIPLGANEKIGVYMKNGVNGFYRAFSTPGGQLTVWVAA